jgi:hypothetical protein
MVRLVALVGSTVRLDVWSGRDRQSSCRFVGRLPLEPFEWTVLKMALLSHPHVEWTSDGRIEQLAVFDGEASLSVGLPPEAVFERLKGGRDGDA